MRSYIADIIDLRNFLYHLIPLLFLAVSGPILYADKPRLSIWDFLILGNIGIGGLTGLLAVLFKSKTLQTCHIISIFFVLILLTLDSVVFLNELRPFFSWIQLKGHSELYIVGWIYLLLTLIILIPYIGLGIFLSYWCKQYLMLQSSLHIRSNN